MRLLVISNHPPEKWLECQKTGWESVVYHAFPNIPANFSRDAVRYVADNVCNIITEITGIEWKETQVDGEVVPVISRVPHNWRVCIQGEYTLCAELFARFVGHTDLLVFPTTERIAEEAISSESVKKESVFKFVQWR